MRIVLILVMCLSLVSCASNKILTLRVTGKNIEVTPPIMSSMIKIKGDELDMTLIREAVRKVDKTKVPDRSDIKISAEGKEIIVKK